MNYKKIGLTVSVLTITILLSYTALSGVEDTIEKKTLSSDNKISPFAKLLPEDTISFKALKGKALKQKKFELPENFPFHVDDIRYLIYGADNGGGIYIYQVNKNSNDMSNWLNAGNLKKMKYEGIEIWENKKSSKTDWITLSDERFVGGDKSEMKEYIRTNIKSSNSFYTKKEIEVIISELKFKDEVYIKLFPKNQPYYGLQAFANSKEIIEEEKWKKQQFIYLFENEESAKNSIENLKKQENKRNWKEQNINKKGKIVEFIGKTKN